MPPYSPALAILTGLFELAAAAWALNSPGRKSLLRPVALILILLAGYQFAEVAVCSRPENLLYSRIAFLDITWLPPVGIWLVYRLLAPKPRRLAFPGRLHRRRRRHERLDRLRSHGHHQVRLPDRRGPLFPRPRLRFRLRHVLPGRHGRPDLLARPDHGRGRRLQRPQQSGRPSRPASSGSSCRRFSCASSSRSRTASCRR